ncbi:hypothetical protein MYIN104542_29880 [Mycobacterium intermedium]
MRNPLSTIIGDLWAGQKPPTQRKRLGMLADPERAHRLLINGTPGINVCEDKQNVLFGKRDRSGTLGEQVPKLILPLPPVVSGDLMKRLSTSRSKRPRPQVGILNIRPRLPEIRHRPRQAEQRVIDLLGPATHLSPPRIPLARVGEIAKIKVALGQVEHRPVVLGVTFDLGQQQIAIPRILLRVLAAGTNATRFDVIPALEACRRGAGVVAHNILVNDAHVTHGQSVAEHKRAPVGAGPLFDAQAVNVGTESGEVRRTAKYVVGVHDPDIVGVALGKSQRLGAIMAEVAPWAFVKLSRDAKMGHAAFNDILGPVVGTGVHDHP